MKKIIVVILVFFFANAVHGQDVKVIKFDELKNLIQSKNSEIKVINFWATWCAPCVKELPLFEKLEQQKISDVKIELVNLDFLEKLNNVKKFVLRKGITSEVFLLDETDYNSWIDKVDTSWGGAIPATLFIKNLRE
jgi:thiol-disulfide isomerase/thioredoxin